MKLLIPLFSPATGTWGGLTRVIAVAQAAQAAGHQVAFCAAGPLESTLRQRGFPVYRMPASTMLGLPTPISRIIERRSQTATLPVRPGRDFGSIWLVLFISGMARTGYLHRLVEAELCAAREFGADFLFTDLDIGAFLAAQAAGLPIAAAYQTPMAAGVGSLPWKLLNRAVGRVLKEHRLPDQPVEALCHGPQVLKIIPSIPELEGTDPKRPDVCYVGQLLGNIQPGEFQAEAGKRYVFAYLGTGSISLNVLRRVLPDVFPAGGKQVCLVGAQSVQKVERIGAVEFRPYVPAAGLLPYCGWTICHGGQNSIIQSLMNDVPLLLFPGPIFERRYNARKVQAAGAGKMGEVNEFTPEWLRAALEEQSLCSDQAWALGQRISTFGGAQAAVQAMEQWV